MVSYFVGYLRDLLKTSFLCVWEKVVVIRDLLFLFDMGRNNYILSLLWKTSRIKNMQ